eukprot:CAMPEP_0113968938 /NCGR_PEP_ID=MMETSP0011_2-20120614/9886_1 /TAXON_ID=101924 /ORGANISM="Rhodosorus marinus" /LENGTH=2205 /DNA_ID=CAMNT_0000982233 /DNA_START=174 /DNA_END=6788 /DNA_ORIENTATION=+ /assembly_acc=CAM_ASM_000156
MEEPTEPKVAQALSAEGGSGRTELLARDRLMEENVSPPELPARERLMEENVGEADLPARARLMEETPNPTDAAGNPTDAPGNPTDAPGNPTDAPGNPTDAPGNPTDATANPTDATANPTDAPENPTDAPGNPTDAPGNPTDATANPTDATANPTDAPENPTDAPGNPTDAPGNPTDATANPADATANPADATANPTDAPAQENVPEESVRRTEFVLRGTVLDGSNLGLNDEEAEERFSKFKKKGNVNEIDLSANMLEKVPQDVWNFPKLKKLNLDGNRLRSLSRNSVPATVEFLSLQNNCIESINANWGLPESLIDLNVSKNNIEEIVLGDRQRQLQKLSAQENRLTELHLSSLLSLGELDLSGNSISIARISAGPPLRNLVLARNKIESLNDGDIHESVANGLESVDLSTNALMKIEEEAVLQFHTLKNLDLHDNGKLQEIPVALVTLKSLERLDLTGCNALNTIDSSLSELGFPAIRLGLREKLMQSALASVTKRANAAERKVRRSDRLLAIREEELSSLEEMRQVQLSGEVKLRTALELTSASLKKSLAEEMTRVRSLFTEKDQILSELDAAKKQAADTVQARRELAAVNDRLGETEAELSSARKRLAMQETELARKEKLVEIAKKDMADRNAKKNSASTSAEVAKITEQLNAAREALLSKEKQLESELLNSRTLETDIAEVKKSAEEEILRLHQSVMALEKNRPKNGLSGHTEEKWVADMTTLVADLAVERSETKALKEELRELRSKSDPNSGPPSDVPKDAALVREVDALKRRLEEAERENSGWQDTAKAHNLVSAQKEGLAALVNFRESLRDLPNNYSPSKVKRVNSSDKLREQLLSAETAAAETGEKLKAALIELKEEREEHEKSKALYAESKAEVAQAQSYIRVKQKSLESMRESTAKNASLTEEVARLRKELSVVRAFGDGDGEQEHAQTNTRVTLLQSSVDEKSAEVRRLREMLESKEEALGLLQASEEQLQKQGKENLQLIKETEHALAEQRNKFETLTSSMKSMEQRVGQAESLMESGKRELANKTRALDQVTAERDELRQKKNSLEVGIERYKEESTRSKAGVADLTTNMERVSNELVRTRKALSVAERRSADQESDLAKRSGKAHRLEAIVEEQKGKLRWKDTTLESLHERLAAEKLVSASRLDEMNKLTTRNNELHRELVVLNESLERSREMVSGVEERLNETLETKERRDTLAEEATKRAEHARSALKHAEDQLRAAGEVAVVREKALEEHSSIARRRVMELTEEVEAYRWELRDSKEKLGLADQERESQAHTIADLGSRVKSLEADVRKWCKEAEKAREELKAARAEINSGRALLAWKDNEIHGSTKRLSDTELKLTESLASLDQAQSNLRKKDVGLTAESRSVRELSAVKDKLQAELAAKENHLEQTDKELKHAQHVIIEIEAKLADMEARHEREVFSREEAQVEAKAQREKVDLLTQKLSTSESTVERKTDLLRILEEANSEKEGEHTSTLARLKGLEREFSERGSYLSKVETENRNLREELILAQKSVVDKQDQVKRLGKHTVEAQDLRIKLESSEKTIAQQRLEIGDAGAKLADLQEKLVTQEEETAHHKRREEELSHKLIDRESELSELEAKYKEAEAAIYATETAMNQSDREYRSMMISKTDDLEKSNRRLQEVESYFNKERQLVAFLKGELELYKGKLEKVQGTLEEAYSKKAEQRAHIEDAESTIARLKVELNTTQVLLKTAEDELTSVNNRIAAEQTRMRAETSSIKVLQEKVEAKEESVSQLQRYSKFVNQKLHETEKMLAEKQQQLESASNSSKKLQNIVENLTTSIEEKDRLIRTSEAERIDQVSSWKSKTRALEEMLEQSRTEAKELMQDKETGALRDELQAAKGSVRERDTRLVDLRARLDSVANSYENAKQEVLDLQESQLRKDNELIRVKARIVELEADKESLNSGSRIQAHELQRQKDATAAKLTRAQSDLEKLTQSEEKWRTLCQKMRPIVPRVKELETALERMSKELAESQSQTDAVVESIKSDSRREVEILSHEVDRQMSLVQQTRAECHQYVKKYRAVCQKLAAAIKAGYDVSAIPDDVGVVDDISKVVSEPNHRLSDMVRVTFVLDSVVHSAKEKERNPVPKSFIIVGGDKVLGEWSAKEGCPLQSDRPDRHYCQVSLPRGMRIEYKYVRTNATNYSWEIGTNRRVEIVSDSDTLEVHDRYYSLKW